MLCTRMSILCHHSHDNCLCVGKARFAAVGLNKALTQETWADWSTAVILGVDATGSREAHSKSRSYGTQSRLLAC